MTGFIILCRLAGAALLAAVAGAALLDRLDGGGRCMGRRWPAVFAAGAAAFIALQLAAAAFQASPEDGLLAPGPLWLMAADTWSGRWLLARGALSLATAAVAFMARGRMGTMVLVLAAADLLLLPFSGHGATGDPLPFSLLVHGFHAASAMVWMGAILFLAAMAWRLTPARDAALRRTLALFSPWAATLVAAAVASGIAAAVIQLRVVPALFGTAYGQMLLLKAGPLLAMALGAAAWLRLRYLRGGAGRSPRVALTVEAIAGLGMIGLAAMLSQAVPGRHDDIAWPLPFRINWLLLWPDGQFAWPLLVQMLLGLAVLLAAALSAVFRQASAAVIFLVMALGIGGLGLAGIVTAAYPTTYAVSPASYSAERLWRAAQDYGRLCAECHGAGFHGDGPTMVSAGARAADLTASHTGDHTAGDMYWWITRGREGTAMAGVEQKTTPEQRWDLVNFVRLVALSARASDVTADVAPSRPFLPSIDFAYTDAAGQPAALRDREGQGPVLLVLAQEAASLARLREIAADAGVLAAPSVQVIVVCRPQAAGCAGTTPASPHSIFVDAGAEAILASWNHYRASKAHPDPGNPDQAAGHLEFLIDRFGYVRAKFRGDEGPLPPAAAIAAMARALAAEPKLLPGPDEHIH